MRRPKRWFVWWTVPVLVLTFLGVSPVAASAVESIPALQWPAVSVGRHENIVSSPTGSVTLPCNTLGHGVDLVTYSRLVDGVSEGRGAN